MEHDYRKSLRSVVDAVGLDEDGTIRWYGDLVNQKREFPPDLLREMLAAAISGLVYQAYYVYGSPIRDLQLVDKPAAPSASAHLVRKLVHASRGRGVWQHTGDRIAEADGRFSVEVWGVKYLLENGLGSSVFDKPGSPVSVRMPGILGVYSPGYMMFIGDEGPARTADSRMVRLYWNVTSTGAPLLVSSITDLLNGRRTPFQLKVRYSDNPWTSRADSAVLYMAADDARVCWDDLRHVHETLIPFLRPYVPALTRPLGLGVATADDPGGANSFGTEVCGLIARGLVNAHLAGVTDLGNRLSAVIEAFHEAGRRLDAPYMDSGAGEIAADAWPGVPYAVFATQEAAEPDWLTHADRVGAGILRQALWHRDRCTWLEPPLGTSDKRTLRPAGADLYRGTAGIGLFLAELARQTGDSRYRTCALAALRHAADYAPFLPSLGLYAGACGTGLGVALGATAVGDPHLGELGQMITRSATREALSGGAFTSFDLVSGIAGAIIALIGHYRLGDGKAIELAADLGSKLVAAGCTHENGGISWLDDHEHRVGLVGMAHGASGPLWALAELGAITGERSCYDAAEQARLYEWSWFDDTAGNWPDIRPASALRSRPSESGDHRFDWCYGAPGIFVARMRLSKVSESVEAAQETAIAVSRTRCAAESFPRYGNDICLCHGAAGLAEILSLVPPSLAAHNDRNIRSNLLVFALQSYEEPPWPDGYGLMLGAAGVGLAALRLGFPNITSPLVPIPTTATPRTDAL